jgi:ribosomal protein S21
MAIEVRKRDGDSPNAILFNFTKRMKRSGVMKEIRKRKFHKRAVSRMKRRSSAIHREEKRVEVERMKKLGLA